MPVTKPAKIATTLEVAQHLKVSTRTVQRLIAAGVIPTLNMPGHPRFDLHQVDEALRSRRSAA